MEGENRWSASGVSTVVTLMGAPLRSAFDLATGHVARAIHATTVKEAVDVSQSSNVSATVLSLRLVSGEAEEQLHSLAWRSRCGLPLLLLDEREYDGARLLRLGAIGFRHVVSLQHADAWGSLRRLLIGAAATPASEIRSALLGRLRELPAAAMHFFDVLITSAPHISSANALSLELGCSASTLSSRFLRLGLPSPKRYLSETRLLFAAAMLEDPAVSAAKIALRLRYSSSQCFARHVRRALGLSLSEFRYRHSGMRLILRYESLLLAPHEAALAKLQIGRPLGDGTVFVRDGTSFIH